MNKFSSRKFATMLGCIALFTWLLVHKHLTPESYQTLLMIILPSYFAANVWEKKSNAAIP